MVGTMPDSCVMPGSAAQICSVVFESVILKNLLQTPLAKPILDIPVVQVQRENTEEIKAKKLREVLDRLMPEDDCALEPNSLNSSTLFITSAAPNDCHASPKSQRTVSKLKPILPNIDVLTCRSLLAAKTAQQPDQRPNGTYPVLVALALYANEERNMPARDIYQFITHHFEYYRNCTSNWRNSVRHCLSENKAFVKVSTVGGTAVCKGHRWALAPDKRDGLEKDIVRFLAEEPFNLRHIQPLGKFYAEIDFDKVQQEIYLKQARQSGVSPASMLSPERAHPSSAPPAVAEKIPSSQVKQGTDPRPADLQCDSIDSDFQDLLRDMIDSTMSEAEAGDCVFDDFANSLLAEMSTAPLLLEENGAEPEAAPSAADEEGAGNSTDTEDWNQMDTTLSLLNTLDIKRLLEELKNPPSGV